MLRPLSSLYLISKRNFKNFGHKQQPTPFPTVVWHGFLTMTFIGLGLNWESINKLIFGSSDYDSQMEEDLKNAMKMRSEYTTVD